MDRIFSREKTSSHNIGPDKYARKNRPRTCQRGRYMSMKKTILLFTLLILMFFTACTTLHIHKSDGEVCVSNHFGIIFIKVQPGDSTMIIDTKAFGISKAVDAYNIGYLDETVVLAEDDCRLIIFKPNLNEIQNLIEMLDGQTSICVFDEERRIK